MRPRIFIGCASESRKVASYVRSCLCKDHDVAIWDELFAGSDRSIYEDLVRKAVTFDHAIFIGGRDDRVMRCGNKKFKIAPRDNVYFEFGLYAGILSPDRSYFLIDEKSTIATDLSGIAVLAYSDRASLKKCCDRIRKRIQEERTASRIQLLPSTSLAIGYFNNFIKDLEEILTDLDTLDICGSSYPVKDLEQHFKIVIPDTIDVDWRDWACEYKKRCHLWEIALKGRQRDVSILIDRDALRDKGQFILLDVPRTLRVSFQAVELVLKNDHIGSDKDLDAAKKREVDNFLLTLRNLTKSTVHIDKIMTVCTERLPDVE